MARSEFARSVFINCPFDSQYKPIFDGIIFAVYACGFRPRCALEIDDASEVRIDKIFKIIGDFKLGIHDISRTEVTSSSGLPRFNMPLELGVFLAAKRFGPGRQGQKMCLILDSMPYRYQQFMSDIAGQDIQVHGNSCREAITVVRQLASEHFPRTNATGRDGNMAPLRVVRTRSSDPLRRIQGAAKRTHLQRLCFHHQPLASRQFLIGPPQSVPPGTRRRPGESIQHSAGEGEIAHENRALGAPNPITKARIMGLQFPPSLAIAGSTEDNLITRETRMRYLLTLAACCYCALASRADAPNLPPINFPFSRVSPGNDPKPQASGTFDFLPPSLRTSSPAYSVAYGQDKTGDDSDKKNGDEKNGKDNDVQKILQLVHDGKMTVEEAQEKLAEKSEEKKEEDNKWKWLPEGWNFHGQTTIIPEFDAGFPARYSGPNSLSPNAQIQGTITADLFLGVPLWHGAEFHADLLMWQGFGLSNSFGLESNPNVDAYKAGTETPRFMMAHFFVRQTIGLGGEQEDVPDGQLTLPGKQDVSRLTITVGRMSMSDIFDRNTYNHDPHSQFMSWSGTNLAWDFPADTIGYTTGIAIELNQPDWAVRYGWYQMPGLPNGFTSDDRIFMWPIQPGEITSDGEFFKQWGMILELERRWKIGDHPGAIRLQSWLERGNWASYNQATALLIASPPNPNGPQGVEANIPAAAFGYHYKYGLGLNWEQEIAKNVGVFGRLGWQDGQTAAAVYNDADWTVQLGLSVKGDAWNRPGDTYGLCGNVAGASSQQIAFLQAGGQGISNGDGKLTYGPEMSFETYYDIVIAKNMHFALDYQFFANPAFNRDRGPVSVFLLRYHWEF